MMVRLLLSMAGVFAFVFGAAVLLFVLPGASIHHPSVRGLNYWAAVWNRAFGPGTVRYTLLGLTLSVTGIVLNLKVALPLADLELSRRGRFFLFWTLTGLLAVALLGVLAGITSVTLGAD
jgi:hypothetical protein